MIISGNTTSKSSHQREKNATAVLILLHRMKQIREVHKMPACYESTVCLRIALSARCKTVCGK
ncbi:MAG: hypothetical protein DCC43_13290 [Candidatus Brocadia sp.]|jgi:hypothetical protein|nr:hypothetical protein [Candidatus Brocadia fulgida]MCE7912814.1 hypothetical protein [Candidatus Brocadia sp. AMX3]OQY99449.1 MAG: hypothetical protein B6D35_09155 [Candidatus Brocadia sp. UTAMX2]RIJ93011.1 MAG: hypothetical protein DCC43_13290 [Candidatus Brocadia sp.]